MTLLKRLRARGWMVGWLGDWRVGLGRLVLAISLAGGLAASLPARALPATERLSLLQAFCAGGAGQRAALAQLVEAGVQDDAPWAVQVLGAMRASALICTGAGVPVLLSTGKAAGSSAEPARHAATLEPVTPAPADPPYVPSIVMMRALASAAAELDLFDADVAVRRSAAAQIDKAFATLNPQLVSRVLATEQDAQVRDTLTLAMAKRGLNSTDADGRQKAIAALAASPSEGTRTLLSNFLADQRASLDADSLRAVQQALKSIDRALWRGQVGSIAFSGLSYAGILLITALGLSIAFGLLGVINLAHGEFIMLGAYATYFVERWMQAHTPALFDAYLLVSIPVAFVVCAAAGMLLEVCVIRFLYRRPLETLLATWAVSIAMVKAVQLGVGSQNVEFITPAFLNGGWQVSAGFFITWNRVFAIALAALIFIATLALIRRTRFGLLVRATTQRRDTARALGVAAERIDRLAFGLGTGLAGLAGVVLTQITSVNPSMGTNFVVDAFMVVVLGGAGSLVGTAVSALALGEINQVIEPLHGAVAAKVAILVLIVLIIQRRPQGLFALKTRV